MVTAHIRFKMWFKYLVPAAVVLVALKYAQHDDVILPLTTELNDSYDYIIGGLINQYDRDAFDTLFVLQTKSITMGVK